MRPANYMIGIAFSEDTNDFRPLYTNWSGETRRRHIRPTKIYFGSNEWHPEEQWLMDAVDLETGQTRTFAMRDMRRPEDRDSISPAA